MSYEAKFCGIITIRAITKPELTDMIKLLNDDIEDNGSNLQFPGGGVVYFAENLGETRTIFVDGNGNYHEEDVRDWLVKIAPYTVDGHIEYEGEDGSLWRYRYENGNWYEDEGAINYINSERPIG